jgi:hypothetical protein
MVRFRLILAVTFVFSLSLANKTTGEKMKIKYYQLEHTRFLTNAIWLDDEYQYEDRYPFGGGTRINFGKKGEIIWMESWGSNTEDNIKDENFDVSNIEIKNKEKDYLFFIKEDDKFSEIDYMQTEYLPLFYIYDEKWKSLDKIEPYLAHKIELFYNDVGLNTGISERYINLENEAVEHHKEVKPRELKDGEIPLFLRDD